LFLNYDEEGGFFDHKVPPTPPASRDQGGSTVSIANEIFPGDAQHPSGPYGLGMRVPLIVVSPWSKGGFVNSQVFDHTSLIRFLEARFAGGDKDLIETNITPWRRAVVGDLTSAFDFKTPNTRWPSLPDTSGFKPVDTQRHPDLDVVPPAHQALPRQERGVRPARALPYELNVHGVVDVANRSVRLTFANTGTATAVFHVRSANPAELPRNYTVEPHKGLSGEWDIASAGYDVSVFGPNGFFRRVAGALSADGANLDVGVTYDRAAGLTLSIANKASGNATTTVVDGYSRRQAGKSLGQHGQFVQHWPLSRHFNWYDFTITVAEDPSFEYRLAGHVENGSESTSDPAMGGLQADS
jgi:phospholipase C